MGETHRVELRHSANPDIVGGYWDTPEQNGKRRLVPCKGIDHASRICQNYITRNSLGGGNWTGGAVQELRNGAWVRIGRIAYNGRFFENE